MVFLISKICDRTAFGILKNVKIKPIHMQLVTNSYEL